jgi:tetratricopeptide (TPR) repeat protein
MHRYIFTAAFIFMLIIIPSLARADGDIRDQYGTRSLEAAQDIDAAIKFSNANQSDSALNEIDLAVKADPSCAMAWYWQGIIKCDMGDLDGGIAAYKSCAALSNPQNIEITTDAKTNLGITLGQLKRYDESIYWFSRAITEDPDDLAQENAKDYRNLAITLHLDNQDLAATLAAITGHEIDPQRVEEGMIDDFFKTGQDQEAARVLALEIEVPTIAPRNEPSALSELTLPAPVTDKIIQFLSDPQSRYVLAIPASNHYFIIDTHAEWGLNLRSQKVAGGNISAACLAGGNLYAVIANSPASTAKLVQIDPLSGISSASWNLPGAVDSIAVLPSRKLAFFPVDGDINSLSLANSTISATDNPGQVITADLSEKYIYTRYKDEDEDADTGETVIIDGSPIYVESDDFDWQQTVLFKYYVTPDLLLPAAMRLNAAANGFGVVVSPDGQFVACPGGGGWRPNSGPGGYNVAVFPTADFNKVQNTFAIDAYPLGCAFNPVTHEFAGIRSGDVKIYHLATQTPAVPAITLQGHFNGQAIWSGDGRFLFVAGNDGGISVYKENLTPAETLLSHTWWQSVLPDTGASASGASSRSNPQPVPGLVNFSPATDLSTLQRTLALALST